MSTLLQEKSAFKACEEGNPEALKELFAKGVQTDVRNLENETLLQVASFHGKLEIVKHLVEECQLNIDEKGGPDHFSPLHSAAQNGHYKVVRYLIDKKANVNAGNLNEYSPIHIAAMKNFENIARLLIDHGADVNGGDGWANLSPLHEAVLNNHEDMVDFLVSKGANVNSTDLRKGLYDVSPQNFFLPRTFHPETFLPQTFLPMRRFP